MKVLDRYVLKSFLLSFLGGLLLFSVVGIALDFFARLGAFNNATRRLEGTFAEDMSRFEVILGFYSTYLPLLLKMMFPFIALAAGLLTAGLMLLSNEVTPILAAGVSARRLWSPILLGGLLLSVGLLAFQEFAVPTLSRKQVLLRKVLSGPKSGVLEGLPPIRDGAGSLLLARGYRFGDQSLHGVRLLKPWQKSGFDDFSGEELRWSAGTRDWVAPKGGEWRRAGRDGPPEAVPEGGSVAFSVSAEDVEVLMAKHGTAELSLHQTRELIAKFPDRRSLKVAFHKQLSHPFATFGLLFMGLPFFLGYRRSMFMRSALAVFLAGCYFFFDIFCTSLGDRGDLPSVLAAYLPLVALLSLGAARWRTLPT